MSGLRGLNLLLAFVVEVYAVAAYAYWGATLDAGTPMRIAVAVGAPVVVIALWALFFAPKAPLRWDMPWIAVGKLAVLGGGAIVLNLAHQPTWAAVLMVAVILHLVLALRYRDI